MHFISRFFDKITKPKVDLNANMTLEQVFLLRQLQKAGKAQKETPAQAKIIPFTTPPTTASI